MRPLTKSMLRARKLPHSRLLPLREIVFARDGNRCVYCGGREDEHDFDSRLVLEHIVSRSAGGTWDEANLVAACLRCNSRKGSQQVEKWLLKFIGEAR